MFDIAAIGEVLIDFVRNALRYTQSDVRMKMDGSVGGATCNVRAHINFI